jgi:hypothetical protein
MSVRGTANRDIRSFPLDAIKDRLASLDARRQDWQAFAHATHWYEAMRGERDDPLRRYLWAFVALEVLTNVLYARLYEPAVSTLNLTAIDGSSPPRSVAHSALVRTKKQLHLVECFAVVAGYLSPKTAREDVSQFRKAYKARNDIAHGNQRLTALTFPSKALEGLLNRYVELALNL